MNWDWGEIGVLFVTSFVGAGLAKLIDLAASRYSQKRSRIEKKVTKILEHLKEFGELTELYRFFAYLSESLVRDEEGELIRDSSGELVIDSKILEPEPRFAEAIKSLKGADIETAIAQKIATIRLMSAEVLDLTLEIDPSGELKTHVPHPSSRRGHSFRQRAESVADMPESRSLWRQNPVLCEQLAHSR